MEFLRRDEADLVRDKQDIRASEAHCCWESRTYADMILKEVVVKQPSWQKFGEKSCHLAGAACSLTKDLPAE